MKTIMPEWLTSTTPILEANLLYYHNEDFEAISFIR